MKRSFFLAGLYVRTPAGQARAVRRAFPLPEAAKIVFNAVT
jgi:hypothetical protein